PEFVTSAGFSPDSRLAFTATARNVGAEIIFGGAVQLWDVATGDETVRLVQKEGYVFDAQFSPDGKRILTALSGTPSRDTIQIWDTQSGKRLLTLQGLYTPRFGPPAVRYVSFSPDGRKVLFLSWDQINISDSVTGTLIRTIKPPKETSKPDFLVSS